MYSVYLAQAAREAESLVLSKIKCEDYIILCVEDTTDWKHATTRNVVMQADPDLSRTVLVTTKLDTKLPQFSEPEDLEEFLTAPLIQKLFPRMLGGPFFTSVPAGRVGLLKDFLYQMFNIYILIQFMFYVYIIIRVLNLSLYIVYILTLLYIY